MQNIFIFKVSV